MKNKRALKRRLNSAGNIHQITKTMEMVAASKMKKAQAFAIQGKSYAKMIYEMASDLSEIDEKGAHKFLKSYEKVEKRLVILISTNKGLCGGLNINLFRYLANWMDEDEVVAEFINLGRKGSSFLRKSGKDFLADFSAEDPWIKSSAAVVNMAVEKFLKGEVNEVWLVYNSFISALKYVPTRVRILPIAQLEGEDDVNRFSGYLIEPSVDRVLEALLPHYLEIQLKSAIYEAEASEHSARMMAMKNASDNALTLIDSIKHEYNKVRQQEITTELADIVIATMAIK